MDKSSASPRNPTKEEQDKAKLVAYTQRMERILQNDEKMRVYHHNKLEKSSPVFANTKVTSCSSVLMSNGLSVAMPFRAGSNNRIHAKRNDKLVSVTQ
jgi:hypothetical protein